MNQHTHLDELEILQTERNWVLPPLPDVTAACPDENQITEAFEGLLSPDEQRILNRHVAVCGHCRGLLDLLTATSIQVPEKLPIAPASALPVELRRIGLLGRLQKAVRNFAVVFAPSGIVLPAVGDSGTPDQLDELEQRQVLIKSESIQAVIFARGPWLYVSLFTDKPSNVRSLTLIDVRTRVALRTERKATRKGEVSYRLGLLDDLSGRTFEVSFELGRRPYRRRVRIQQP